MPSRNSQGLVRSECTVNGKRESSETEPLGWTPDPGNGAVHVKVLNLGWVEWVGPWEL
jgi:hypothetical protein